MSKGEILVPILRSYLYDPKFPSFTVPVRGFEARPPDGWFHPSTHPLWYERQLYYYLTEPQAFVGEPYDPTSAMTVTQGQFWHTFIQACLTDCGWLKGVEVKVEDKETGSRGSMDGIGDEEVWEFKTMRATKAQKIVQGAPNDPRVIASFKALVPGYYAQAQEYMRLSGLRRWRGLILSLEWPFPLREIAMPYDELMAYQIRTKYLTVRQAVADQSVPKPCCGVGSKEAKACPARTICPIGRMS
jgi:hypothetical protein